MRKIALVIAEIRKRGLNVKRRGVVDVGGNFRGRQVLAKRIAVFRANRELIVDMISSDNFLRPLNVTGQSEIAEQLRIAPDVGAPLLGPLGEMLQFDAQDSGLERIEAAIGS